MINMKPIRTVATQEKHDLLGSGAKWHRPFTIVKLRSSIGWSFPVLASAGLDSLKQTQQAALSRGSDRVAPGSFTMAVKYPPWFGIPIQA